MQTSLRKVSTLTAAVATMVGVCAQQRWEPSKEWLKEHRFLGRPEDGFVTKRETAIAVGRAVIRDAFDDRYVKALEPLGAKRFGDVWVVYSFSPRRAPKENELPLTGGVTTVEISASTGTVINLSVQQ
jgi:hypothetical protein